MTNPCRHFKQGDLFIGDGGCGIGHPIHKMIEAKTKEPLVHVLRRLCCKGNGTTIIDCPDVDFKTDEEVEADKTAQKKWINEAMNHISYLSKLKSEMIEKNVSFRCVDCPMCGENVALVVRINIGGNNHMNAKCNSCRFGLIE